MFLWCTSVSKNLSSLTLIHILKHMSLYAPVGTVYRINSCKLLYHQLLGRVEPLPRDRRDSISFLRSCRKWITAEKMEMWDKKKCPTPEHNVQKSVDRMSENVKMTVIFDVTLFKAFCVTWPDLITSCLSMKSNWIKFKPMSCFSCFKLLSWFLSC